MADIIHIDGPQGPLAAELIRVTAATDLVIIIPGSGATDRDGNSTAIGLHSDSYRLLAEALAANGIASLRIDKRGLFGSRKAIADPNAVTIAHYAQDVAQWVQRATQIAPQIWLAGHSEGGLVALVSAGQIHPPIAGLILLATAGRSIGPILIEQLAANPANRALMPELQAIIGELQAGRLVEPGEISAAVRPLFSSSLQKYMIDLIAHDPSVLAKNWPGPTLIVQGDNDMQIRFSDAELLAQAFVQSKLIRLHGATHMLKQAVPDDPYATYSDPALPLHDALISSVVAFIASGGKI